MCASSHVRIIFCADIFLIGVRAYWEKYNTSLTLIISRVVAWRKGFIFCDYVLITDTEQETFTMFVFISKSMCVYRYSKNGNTLALEEGELTMAWGPCLPLHFAILRAGYEKVEGESLLYRLNSWERKSELRTSYLHSSVIMQVLDYVLYCCIT